MSILWWIAAFLAGCALGMLVMATAGARRSNNLEAKVSGYRAEVEGLRAALKVMQAQRDGARAGQTQAFEERDHWKATYPTLTLLLDKRAAEKGKAK